jgi:hypothetical protein
VFCVCVCVCVCARVCVRARARVGSGAGAEIRQTAYVAQGDLKFVVLLLQSPKFWD